MLPNHHHEPRLQPAESVNNWLTRCVAVPRRRRCAAAASSPSSQHSQRLPGAPAPSPLQDRCLPWRRGRRHKVLPAPAAAVAQGAAPCRRSGAPREATAKAPAVDLLRLLRLRLRLLLGWSSSCSVPISAHSLLSFGAGQTLDTLWLKDGPFVCGQSQVSVADLLLACETDELCLLDGAEQVDPAAAAAAASAATAAAAAAAGSTS